MVAAIMNETVIPIAHIIATLSASIAAVVSVAYRFKQDREINALKEKIRLLTEIPLTLKNGIYFNGEGYPFCPACRGSVPPLFIPLTKLRTHERTIEYQCSKCKTYFEF
jgi:hypothetical protein